MNLNDRENNIIKGLIKGLNTNIKRKSLKELLKEDKPHTIINGKRHRFNRDELLLLKQLGCSENLKLPISIEVDSSLGNGTYIIKGIEEIKIINKILNKEINYFEELKEQYIYRPELRIIRKKLPTTTNYLFRLSL